ncbi:MAG: hypothetical protein R3C17_21685 [Planctomycetaceae bacterium]
MVNKSTEGSSPFASDNATSDPQNPYATEMPLEHPLEPRRKLSIIEAMGGVFLGVIGGLIASCFTCVGLGFVGDRLFTALKIKNPSSFTFLMLVLLSSITVGAIVAVKVFRDSTKPPGSGRSIRQSDK